MDNHRISNEKLIELQPDIKKWKEQFKNIILISLSEDPFDGIFKVPDAEDMKAAGRLKDDMDKNKQIVLTCLIFPKVEIFNAILEEKGGIVVPLATRLVDEYGATQETTVKKL